MLNRLALWPRLWLQKSQSTKNVNKERNEQMLTITDDAKAELLNVLQQNPGKSLRVVMAGFG